MSKRILTGLILVAFMFGIGASILFRTAPANAALDYNRLIDDSFFDDTSTMNATQIDSWLNTYFPSSCISTNHGFQAPDPIGYNPTDGFLYGGNVSAGRVIYDSAIAYGLNPQVLLVTLQKEQSLVSGEAGCSTLRYAAATGYGCPDGGTTYSYSGVNLYTLNGVKVTSVSGTCVNSSLKVGFSQQVIRAAWLLKFGQQRSLGNTAWAVIKGNWNNSDDPPTCYGGPMTEGFRKRCSSESSPTFYDGYTTIDGTSVHMDTGATAALYWYTPHKSGNSHFYSLFTGWFGNTKGPFYSLSSQTLPSSKLEYGKTASVQFKIVNRSSQTWYSDGHLPATGTHSMRLMTDGYKNTSFANNSDSAWMGTKNQIRMVENSVAPNAVATFNFTIRAPQYTTSQTIHMFLVHNGVRVYTDVDLHFTVTSTPDYAYQVLSVNVPSGILPGDAYKVVVKLKNTGAETWYSDANRYDPSNTSGHPIRLATSGYRNSPFSYPKVADNWLTQNQIRMVEPSVAPGQTGTFQAVIYAPYKQVVFAHDFRLVLDGVKFIGGPAIPATVWTPPVIARYSVVGNKNIPVTIPSGDTKAVSVTVHNSGNLIWRNIHRKVYSNISGQTPLRDTRMMTWSPGYRNSIFAAGTSEWLGTKNQITPVTKIVSPGENATYTVNFKAPAVSKKTTYTERFNLVVDGLVVMPDQGLTFTFTVTP